MACWGVCVADLLDGLARWGQERGLVTYDPDGIVGDCFVEAMPAGPDVCTVLTLYGLGEPDAALPYDETGLQVRTRGGPDPRVSRARAQSWYYALHGARRIDLPDGTYLILAVAIQTPASLGMDEQRRFEHVVNFRLDVSSLTVNRPLEGP